MRCPRKFKRLSAALLALLLHAHFVVAAPRIPEFSPAERPDISRLKMIRELSFDIYPNYRIGVIRFWAPPETDLFVVVTYHLFGYRQPVYFMWRIFRKDGSGVYDDYAAFSDGRIYPQAYLPQTELDLQTRAVTIWIYPPGETMLRVKVERKFTLPWFWEVR